MRDAWFYTDGIEDLPLLDRVGRPVVVNPKARLAKVAGERGWPHMEFVPPPETGREADGRQQALTDLRGTAQRLFNGIAEKGRAALARRRSR